MICTFFGHRDTSEAIKPKLKTTIKNLIDSGVKNFYVGNNGSFDLMTQCILFELKAQIDIDYRIVLSYINEKAISGNQDATIYPEGFEHFPRRFAISKRNDWLIAHSTHLIAHSANALSNSHKWIEKAERKGLTVINLADLT